MSWNICPGIRQGAATQAVETAFQFVRHRARPNVGSTAPNHDGVPTGQKERKAVRATLGRHTPIVNRRVSASMDVG
jgi:hypothetical protein